MKAVSKHIERMFMKTLVTYSRDNGYRPIDVHEDALSDLKRRPDFENVITFLRVKGYLETDVYDGEIWFITLCEKGVSYFEDERDFITERRWTRGLAIAAIIISLCALMLELDDRGMLGGLLDGVRTTRSARPASEQSTQEQSTEQ